MQQFGHHSVGFNFRNVPLENIGGWADRQMKGQVNIPRAS